VKREDDGKYHVVPTVSPENWGCTVDFRLNRDCIMDLVLIGFLMEAVVKGSEILNVDAREREQWQSIRTNLASYPRARAFGSEVWLDVPNAPTGWIYNIPVTLAPVFPGERVGLHSNAAETALARHTAETIRLEGGNDIVYQPLIRARLGMLDFKWFKQEVRYCELPNGIVNDRVRQTGGRYKDSTDFDFMMRMGVWTENLSLPVVINECLLQSYSGVIRLFPNTQNLGATRFHKLRAAGAFLISANWNGQRVGDVVILSERGNPARIAHPWAGGKVTVSRLRDRQSIPVRYASDSFEFSTEPDQTYHVVPQN
jgi:alpha-L-fucosidase 2